MAFWIFMLIMDLLVPSIMIGFGSYFVNHAPKKINIFYGYRTRMSMKSRETWEFAHHCMGRIWRAVGWIMLPLTVISMLPCIGKNEDFVGGVGAAVCLIQTVILVVTIFPVEAALKKNFDKFGQRK